MKTYAILMCVLVAALILLGASMVLGQCTDGQCGPSPAGKLIVKRVLPAVVRIGSRTRSGLDLGSGTIIGRKGEWAYVLTAWHVLRDHHGPQKPFVIVMGKGYDANILKVDKVADVALLAIADPGVEPIQFAESLPILGDPLRAGGYGSDGKYHLAAGQCRQYVSFDKGKTFNAIEASARVRVGDSGGPILNARGRLVAVISCGDRITPSAGTCFPRIRAIMRGVLPPYPRRPGWIVPKIRRPLVPVAPPPRPVVAPVAPEPQAEAEPVNISPPQIAALEARVAALEAQLAGVLFIAQVETADGQTETADICLGGILSLNFSPISKEK